MRRHARANYLARTRLHSQICKLRLMPPSQWPEHRRLAYEMLCGKLSPADACEIVIQSFSAAHACVQRINQRSIALAQDRIRAKVSKAFRCIRNCAVRGSAALRSALDRDVAMFLRKDSVNLETIETLLDSIATTFEKYSKEEAGKTALTAISICLTDGTRSFWLKSDFSALTRDDQPRIEVALSAVTASGARVKASDVFEVFATVLAAPRAAVSSQVHSEIITYVTQIARIWENAGLRPGRGTYPELRDYISPFHRYANLLLWAASQRRYNGKILLSGSADRATKPFPPRDHTWIVSEDHVRKALIGFRAAIGMDENANIRTMTRRKPT